MRWVSAIERIEGAFDRGSTRLVVADGTVTVPAGGLDLDAVMREAAETEDELERWSEGLCNDRTLRRVLGFEWATLGPMSWFVGLDILDLGTPRAYLCVDQRDLEGEQPCPIVAAVEPKSEPSLWSALLVDLITTNGADYGVDLFGDLPTETVNHAPGLLPEAMVREAYSRWLDAATWSGWPALARYLELLGDDPTPLDQALIGYRALDDPEKLLASIDASEPDLSKEKRDALLDQYFAYCYTGRD